MGRDWIRRRALLAGVLALVVGGCDGGGGGGGGPEPEDGIGAAEDTIEACVPACEGLACGPDGCGGVCGACAEGEDCLEGLCVAPDPCIAACAARECGPVADCDCGTCPTGLDCLDGTCDTPLACDFSGFHGVRTDAISRIAGNGGYGLYVQALAGNAAPFDLLVLELDPEHGGITGAGDVDAAFDSFDSHGAWLYMLRGWQGASVKGWTGGGYEMLMVPLRGRIEVQSLGVEDGGRFTATLHAVQLAQATVDPDSGEITLVSHGETWCLDGLVLDAEVAHPNPACGVAGNGIQLGDVIEDFSLVNCYGQWVNLHDHCHRSEALWLVATAGW